MFHRLVLLTIVGAVLLSVGVGLSPVKAQAATGVTATVRAFRLNVRSGPGMAFTRIGRLTRNETVAVLGRNARSIWLKIQTSTGLVGWVAVRWVRLSAGKVGGLPVVS